MCLVELCGGFLFGQQHLNICLYFLRRRSLATLYVVCFLQNTPVVIVLLVLICQMCAAVWYTASYIPYGRSMIKSTLCPCLKDLENQEG